MLHKSIRERSIERTAELYLRHCMKHDEIREDEIFLSTSAVDHEYMGNCKTRCELCLWIRESQWTARRGHVCVKTGWLEPKTKVRLSVWERSRLFMCNDPSLRIIQQYQETELHCRGHLSFKLAAKSSKLQVTQLVAGS